MGKIFCLMGKSACGKDTIYKQILSDQSLRLKTVITYTTRPIRDGETNGVEYYFLTEHQLQELKRQGKVIELRSYYTVHGTWNYLTVNDGQIDLSHHHYLMIGTLESYVKLQKYYGANFLIPLYVELAPDKRLERALNRERTQANPRYAELCRRFLADESDFSPENLAEAGIVRSFCSDDSRLCAKEIISYIRKYL